MTRADDPAGEFERALRRFHKHQVTQHGHPETCDVCVRYLSRLVVTLAAWLLAVTTQPSR